MAFPSKAEREKCWASRDEFWKCLDDNSASGNQEICAKFREMYENTCPSQWVKHFDRKREYLKFKDRIQKEGLKNSSCGEYVALNPTGMLRNDCSAATTAISLRISRTCVGGVDDGDNSDSLNILHRSPSSTSSNNTSSSSSSIALSTSEESATKIPSPRIFRRWHAFQPPTFS